MALYYVHMSDLLKYNTIPWPVPSLNKQHALSSQSERILRQTVNINKNAFSYSALAVQYMSDMLSCQRQYGQNS